MIKSNNKELSCINCSTENCFIKKYCSSEYIITLSDVKKVFKYRENQYVVYEESPVMGLFFIQNGRVKIVSTGIDEKPHLVRLTKQGGIIGHRGYGGEKYPISAITLNEATVCFIDNDTIYKAFMDNPKLTFELMMYYSRELRKSESKIKSQAQMNVREKVADALLSCNTMFNEDKIFPFQIELNRNDLADFAGINTEQLSRVLSEFKKDDIIKVEKNTIQITETNLLEALIAPFGRIEGNS